MLPNLPAIAFTVSTVSLLTVALSMLTLLPLGLLPYSAGAFSLSFFIAFVSVNR